MPQGEAATETFVFSTKPATARAEARCEQEAELVERFRAGDQEAFADLYRQFAPMVHGIVLARVPRDEVQDIVQEVFLAAYRNLHSLRDSRVFGPWLVKITRNQAAEFYRSSKPTEELPEHFPGGRRRDNEAAEVLRAIRSLSDSYRETLILRLVEGMTAKEIAARTGMKPESVRVNLHRGMQMLRERLGIREARR
jgi:RNA polymerase sigma-70 factor (ECF subfamily)